MDIAIKDVTPKTCEGGFCCMCMSSVVFVATILFFPCTVIQLGQLKYGLVKNKVTGSVDLENVFEPGRYWIGFWKEFIEFPSYICTIEFSDEAVEEDVQSLSRLRARDQEGKLMLIDVSLQYQLFPDEIGDMYREMTTLYEDVFISELRDRLSKVGNRFVAEDIWLDYTSINTMMHEECVAVLSARHANCWGVQIWGLSLNELYENSIVRTQVRKQAQRTEQARLQSADVRARTQVILAEYRKNITIIQSAGEATKYNIERQATAQAEGNLISVEARALALVRDVLAGGSGTLSATAFNGTAGNLSATAFNGTNGTSNTSYFIAQMTNAQLMKYQKYMMLHRHTEANLVYHANSQGDAAMEAVNVASARTIMNNGRRLAEAAWDTSMESAPVVAPVRAPGPATVHATLTPRQHTASMRVGSGLKRQVSAGVSSNVGQQIHEL